MQPGEQLTLGTYHQTISGDDHTPILWRVLTVEEDRALLLSEKALDYQTYHNAAESVSWDRCTLKKWLEGTFLPAAFTEEEQSRILQITCLSRDELKYLDSVLCAPTEYANINGTYIKSDTVRWWLRDQGNTSLMAMVAGHEGQIFGLGVKLLSVAVRPAIWIRL